MDVDHDSRERRFVVRLEGTESVLTYTRPPDGEVIDLRSTWVDPSVRGRGVGDALVRAALDFAREESLEVIPTCWFVSTVVKRRPRYRDLLR